MRTFNLMVKILILSLWSTNTAQSLSDSANYFSLILNVHRYFGTSCVFIIHNRRESLTELDRIHELLYKFSSVDVLASSLEFVRINETMRRYGHSVVRPLVVVSLRDDESFVEFKKLASYFNMAGPCWLLLINDAIYQQSFTGHPSQNILNLKFNTEMLVARTNRTNIEEWYWLNSRVQMEDLAEWDFDTEFILANNKSLYQRRSNLEGLVIPVTTVNNPPILTLVNNTIGGLCGAILLELSRVANFDIEIVSPREQSYGSWDRELKKWSGMIEVLIKQEAMIGVAEFTITGLRTDAIDFTFPLITTRDKLFIRQPEIGISWSSYWKTLAPGNWVVIQIIILTTTALLTFITFVGRSRITADVVSEYLLLVFGIYCQQGLPEFPSDSPSRIVYFSIFLSASVVLAAYSAALISFLTVTSVKLPFTTLEEFVDDGTYQLIVFKDGAEYDMFVTTREPTMAKMRRLLKNPAKLPRNLREGFAQVCSERVALYLPGALEEAYKIALPCKLAEIDTRRTTNLAMALSKGNSYNGLINYHIQKFRDHGLLDRLKRKYAVAVDSPPLSHPEVTATGIVPILVILTGGIFLASMICFFERFLWKKQSRECAVIVDIRSQNNIKTISRNDHRNVFKPRSQQRTKYLTPPSKTFYL